MAATAARTGHALNLALALPSNQSLLLRNWWLPLVAGVTGSIAVLLADQVLFAAGTVDGNLGRGLLVRSSPRSRSFKRCASCPPGDHDQWHRPHRAGMDLLMARPGAGHSHTYGWYCHGLHRCAASPVTRKIEG